MLNVTNAMTIYVYTTVADMRNYAKSAIMHS